MDRVEGKVAIITGAASSKGIGMACAVALLKEGARVMVTDINSTQLNQSVSSLDEADDRLAFMYHDVGNEADWDAAVAETVRRFGKLDILVNNAGISQMRSMEVVTEQEWQDLIRINLTGTFLGARAVMRQMRKQGHGGSVINVSSIAGIVGIDGMPAYTASKGGVRMLSKNIALEGAPDGIRCNSVHPGVIWTEILQDTIANAPGKLEATQAMIPMRRLGTPADVAQAVLFLASDDSGYVTGTELIVDGGLTAQ